MDDNQWHQEETYKSLILFGNNSLKFVLLINGGAVIALLTFLGNLLKYEPEGIQMVVPMGCFLLGIIVGGLANITAYFTQLTLYNEDLGNISNANHMRWLYGTLALIIISIMLFSTGSILTLLELQSYS